jgi:hypothetical protein
MLIPLLFSCVKELDFDNLDELEYRGQWVLPIINADLTLGDVVAGDSTFTADPDGGIRIIFEEDSIFGASIAEFVAIPDQDPQEIPFVAGSPAVNLEFELGTLGAGEQLKRIELSKGLLKWTVDNPVSNPVQFELAILNATLNGDTAKFVLSANTMGLDTGSIDISGLDFDLTQGNLGYNNLKYRTQILNDGGAPIGTSYKSTVQLVNIVLDEAVGYFGDRSVNLPSLIQNTNISGFENILNGLRIENPTIDLKIVGNVGLPFAVETDMDGINKNGSVLPLSIPTLVYNAPVNQGDWDTSRLTINKANSNIVDFISNVPDNIAFAGKINLNPNGNTGTDNFITQNGEMYVGVRIDIPLEIKTQDLIVEQLISDFNLDFDEEQSNAIEKLKMHFKVTNGFPFDANLQLEFIDVVDDGAGNFTAIVTDSVNVDLLTSAIVDGSGRVETPTVSRSEIEFNQANIQNLLDADRLNIRVTLNSYNNGNDLVKLYTDDFINIIAGIDVKLKVKL